MSLRKSTNFFALSQHRERIIFKKNFCVCAQYHTPPQPHPIERQPLNSRFPPPTAISSSFNKNQNPFTTILTRPSANQSRFAGNRTPSEKIIPPRSDAVSADTYKNLHGDFSRSARRLQTIPAETTTPLRSLLARERRLLAGERSLTMAYRDGQAADVGQRA